jgi:hypothetical protein
MSFFVKCPQQRPVQGRFKKVQMYGAIEDKDMALCTILKRPTPVNVEGITKKDIHMLPSRSLDRILEFSEAFHESQNGHHERVKGLFTKLSNI